MKKKTGRNIFMRIPLGSLQARLMTSCVLYKAYPAPEKRLPSGAFFWVKIQNIEYITRV
jgi:hypothetical protein